MISQILSKLIREPIVHFLVLGTGLFMVYSAVKEPASMIPDRIIVEETQALRLAEQFQRTWMRPPTKQELQSLANEHVKEEILYREALALGLDKNDLVIRRRLRQKMEFINEEVTDPRTPSDAELQAFFDANLEGFRKPTRLSFQQIYLNPIKAAGGMNQTVSDLLTRLNSDPTISDDTKLIGDITMLPKQLNAVTESEVAHTFGERFAKGIENATTDRWSGPYESSYGLHLVRILEREEGGFPEIKEIRPILEREWYNARRKEAKDRYYQKLRERYEVEIRLPAGKNSKTLAVR